MSYRFRTAGSAAAVAVVLVAASSPVRAAGGSIWPQPGHDSGHSFYNADESVLNAGTVGSLKARWQVVPAPTRCPGLPSQVGPVVAGGLTLMQDTSGLTARDSRTGEQVWKTNVGIEDRWAYNLVVAGSNVVVTASGTSCGIEGGESDGTIMAYNLATGARRWSASDDTEAQQVVVVDGTLVVSGSSSGVEPIVTGYRLSDGRRLWSDGTNSDGARTLAALVPVGHEVIVNHFGRETLRLNAVTGAPTGSWPASWHPLASVAGDRVVVGDSDDWTLKAVHVSDQRVLWSVDRVSNRVASDGRRLYVGIGSSIEAYDAATGRLAWSVALGGRAGQPVRAGGLVYVPVAGKPVAVRDAATGRKVAASSALSSVRSVLAVAGGRLYATTAPNHVTVFAP